MVQNVAKKQVIVNPRVIEKQDVPMVLDVAKKQVIVNPRVLKKQYQMNHSTLS
jgi:hypothetical protein